MARILIFNVLFFLGVGYALTRGGWPERAVAVIFCVARLATDVVLYFSGLYYHQPELGEMVVDSVTFVALLYVALTADRYWPLLVTAMHGVSILAHLGRLITFDILPHVYLNAVQLWAYPELIVLSLGAARVDLRAFHHHAGWWPFHQKISHDL